MAEAAAANADADADADAADREAAEDANEQQKLRDKAKEASLEPQGLEPQPANAMPYRGLAHRADGSPTPAAQRNHRCAEGCACTDPDSHIVNCDGNVLQGCNCQAVVDGDHQVIVAMGVSNQPPDVEHLVPRLERTIAKACEKRGVDPHIATGRLPHGKPPPPIYGPIPKDLDAKGRMARKLRKKKGKKIYAGRKTIVEQRFGQAKEGRGLRRFLLRGLEKVSGEWLLWGATHHLNKLWRYLKKQKQQEALAMGLTQALQKQKIR